MPPEGLGAGWDRSGDRPPPVCWLCSRPILRAAQRTVLGASGLVVHLACYLRDQDPARLGAAGTEGEAEPRLTINRGPYGFCACGSALGLSRQRDALYCPACDEWREEPCGNPGCAYCGGRPPRPSLDR